MQFATSGTRRSAGIRILSCAPHPSRSFRLLFKPTFARAPLSALIERSNGSDNRVDDDDQFQAFAPDFDSYPTSGQLLVDWLPVDADGHLVPAGPGKPKRTGFQLWQQRVVMQSTELTLVGPSNINSITFWYWNQGKRDLDPFWARPWPSGLALADLILREPELVRGKRIIELGAGVGGPGIAAAIAGASQVVITDREPLALQCAALSARASGLTAEVNLLGKQETSNDSNHTPQIDMQQSPKVLCHLLDWSQPVPDGLGTFDLILATDVLYEHLTVPMLVNVISQLLGCTANGANSPEKASLPQRETGLLLAEFPDRYPANQHNFQMLLQDTSLDLHLAKARQELVKLPAFENEMLDILIDREHPLVKTDYLMFKQRKNVQAGQRNKKHL